ncbi:MAG: DEAD/DEAH box helicase [Deltaproteobacteria bacterium]|nr:DEAD/DEAH box helicase [Deltaproteobacteria bacterium]
MSGNFEERGIDPRSGEPTAPKRRAAGRRGPVAEPTPAWMDQLERLGGRPTAGGADPLTEVFEDPRGRDVRYQLNVRETRVRDALVIDFYQREAKRDGQKGAFRPLEVDPLHLAELPTVADKRILQLLLGNFAEDRSRAQLGAGERYSRSVVRPGLYDVLLPELCRTGRFVSEAAMPGTFSDPLAWDDGEPFRFELTVDRAERGWRLWGRFVRDGEAMDPKAPRLVLSGGVMIFEDRLALHEATEAFDWVDRLRRGGPVEIPFEAQDQFLVRLSTMPNLPEVALPPELHWSQVRLDPVPRVCFAQPDVAYEARFVVGKVSFDYGGKIVSVNSNRRMVADESGRQLFRRDRRAERRALERLRALGLEAAEVDLPELGEVCIAHKDLYAVVKTLVEEGWYIEADGAQVRAITGGLATKVSSGIDWFDVDATLDYGGVQARLPELLVCAQSGGLVSLRDGTKGIAPDWLSKYASMAQVGRLEGDKLRFAPSQAGVIDALLTGADDVSVDVKFDRIQKVLRAARPHVSEPVGFMGKLRDYQQEGLGWLRFLEDNNFSGCLADDMGLGKTVQVLAMLQGRHRPGGQRPSDHRPSLIVVPKSLVYNWIKEASKFAPDLKAVPYTGGGRLKYKDDLLDQDLVVTTYGTLRQDILHLLEIRWNAVVLDEAQAIKNPRSQAAKACRLLRSEYRLAISGTPIENSLDELWSLFEFLNPGMLGGLDDFSAKAKGADDGWLELLSTSLRPFMLRRTKQQVLTELPEKTELTLMVDLDEDQRKKYDELRDYYRASLSSTVQEVGLGRAKIQVLEALLRLRQAACHPGLIDTSRLDEPSSKLEVLYEKLDELIANGHKALIFSQFTRLLGVVKRWLEARGIKHEYLDGATRDRQAGVDRFQSDPENKVFLISLKAGGCGITLTSSDYVFLLDPWWNPAVEAQAIDRAHRMGQKNPVFAYRLIARDTVEEKIAKLQEEKRKLADAIITGETGLMKELTMEDLERLFG